MEVHISYKHLVTCLTLNNVQLDIYLKHTLAFFFPIAVFMASCAKEHSCEDCIGTGAVIVPTLPGNQAPIAIAFYDSLNSQPPGSKFVTAKYSTDADGSILSYHWRKITGPGTPIIIDPSSFQTVITNLVNGLYTFELTVTDNDGLTGRDTVVVRVDLTVNSNRVIADAGPDQTITLPLDSTYLDGSKSLPNGFTSSSPATFIWNCIRGPRQYVLNQFTLGDALNLTTVSANGLVAGIYLYELRVTTSGGLSDVDTVQITVVNDPLTKNSVTYHDLIWTEGDPGGLGQLTTYISSPVKPDLFTASGAIKSLEVSLKSGPASPFITVPFKSTSAFTWDASVYSAWIMTVPNNPLLVGKKADLRIRFL